MALTLPSRRELLTLLQTQMLPRVERQSAPLLLAFPPVATPGVHVVPQLAPLLRSTQQGRSSGMTAHWVEEGFNAARYPTFIWVIEGEADVRIGVTRRMAAQNKELSKKHGFYIASLPAGSFLIMPPGIPFSDASRPHWERPHLSEARSRLLWFHFVPAGVSLHTCTTQGAQHASTRSIFLSDTRLMPLAEVLVEELQQRATHGEAMARHYLAVLLLYLERHIRDLRMPVEEAPAAPTGEQAVAAGSTPVLRACQYIDTHLSHKLTLALIASYCRVSPTHLNRLFRAEMNMTAGEYLQQRRLERARSLLETTDLTIQRVGVVCGFPQAAHFNRAFRQHTGLTPGAYRLKSRR
jgi:AraC-like DNA-binding protein